MQKEVSLTGPMAAPTQQKDIKWVEGLRGISAVFIVSSHVYLALYGAMNLPAESEEVTGTPIRLPFIRLHGLGAPWLAIFFILTGFVNAYKPIKQARRGEVPASLSGLNSSTFRRTWRLVLPTLLITFISWTMAQMGLTKLASEVGEWWLGFTAPPFTPGLLPAIRAYFAAVWTTWAGGDSPNVYDKNLWPMYLLLKSSMIIYVALLGTIRCKAKYRMLTFFALLCYSYKCQDTMLGANIYIGALLAEISMYPITTTTATVPLTLLRRSLILFFFLFGAFVAGFPADHWEWTSWSRFIARIGWHIFPKGTHQVGHWPYIGAQCMTVAIVLSPRLQRWLSYPTLGWLGGVSFPMYLIHGTLLRTVLPWILWGWNSPQYSYTKNDAGVEFVEVLQGYSKPPVWLYVIALAIFWVLLAVLSHYWSMRIEPWFGWVVKEVEGRVCMKVPVGEKQEARPNGRLPPVNGVMV